MYLAQSIPGNFTKIKQLIACSDTQKYMITKIEILKKKHIVQSEHSVALQENYGINAESTYI